MDSALGLSVSHLGDADGADLRSVARGTVSLINNCYFGTLIVIVIWLIYLNRPNNYVQRNYAIFDFLEIFDFRHFRPEV